MPPANLQMQNLRGGSVPLSKWLNLPTGSSPLQEIVPQLVPVIEMAPFQRRFQYGLKQQSVGIGQQAVFQLIVPDDQAWRLSLLWVEHDNLGLGGVVFRFRRQLTNNLQTVFFALWEGEVNDTPGGEGEVIYPSAVQRARVASNNFADLRGDGGVDFWPGDTLTLTMGTQAIAAGQVQLAIVIEEIPIPERIQTITPLTSVAV